MQSKTLFITRLAVLIALTLGFQMLGLPQPITGPVINAILFISCFLIGPWTALALGCLTPLAAVVGGQLPPPLWPLAPCVAAANGILVLAFQWIRPKPAPGAGRPGWAAVGISILMPSLLKFAFLSLSVKNILPLLLGRSLPPLLVYAFTAPQFFTALAGGIVSLPLMKIKKADLPGRAE
jgi:hypothetical protein